MVEFGWSPTGFVQRIDNLGRRRMPQYDPRSGEHFWIVMPTFRVDPTEWRPDNTPMLDAENLMMVAGPLCFHCEQFYTDRLARRRCPGDP